MFLGSCKERSAADSGPEDYRVEPVADGFEVVWGLAFVERGKLLFTERYGGMGLVDLNTGKVTRVIGAPKVMTGGQGGLLDVAIGPGYDSAGWVYLTYVKEVAGRGVTTLARGKLAGERLVGLTDLLITRSATDSSVHFGSRIGFDGEGHLFFSVGDRGVRPNSQELSNHAGAILRLKVDGAVPGDNPFVDRPDALPEIWSYGHRNPQGLFFDRATGRLWSIEHGPRGGDELNLIEPGANYGWPVISYGKEYWGPVSVGEGTHKEGMTQPVKYYVPSIAPGSLIVYSGKAFPKWRGNLLAGSLVLKHLNLIQVDEEANATGERRILGELDERIRAVAESPEGYIYLSTDSGRIMRLVPTR